jgi:hypothetical protein|tara:strand:+ start:66 stop:368 length:303 start_codon:yes stop_codon:yes gene_type:complete
MYTITFKTNKTKITLALKNPKFYLEWQEDIFKYFITKNLDQWNKTIEVITSSPEPFKSGNFVQTWTPDEFLRSIGWYHVSLPIAVKDNAQYWNKNRVEEI